MNLHLHLCQWFQVGRLEGIKSLCVGLGAPITPQQHIVKIDCHLEAHESHVKTAHSYA